MKLTALTAALIAALGLTAGCSTQGTLGQSRTATMADAHAQYTLGRFYQGQQRYELAIEAYRRALAVNPAHAGAHNGLGASLLLAGRNAEAVEQFKSGLRHHPRSAALWNNLGYAYQLGGENRLAEMAYKQSLDLDPADSKTSANLAMAQQASPQAASAPAVAAQAPIQIQPVPTAAAETRTIPVYPARDSAAEAAPAADTPAPATALAPAVASPQANAAPGDASLAVAVPAASAAPTVTLQPGAELASTATAAPAVRVVEVAPRVYEMKLPDTSATAIAANQPAPGAVHISVPLRDNAIQLASIDSDDFVLEIRNGNGVRHLALHTSQQLAGHGYTTNYLSNERGFNVKVTKVLYLPGYLEEAKRLLAHLPKDTVLEETASLRPGSHVRVVLGRDMESHAIRTAAQDGDDFVLEIRNGNGVRHLALHTSQQLAGHGYTTNYLSNERGFNVRVTKVLYLPGYLEEAKRLLAHLPKDTVLAETASLRPGVHVRVVLGRDMA